MEADFMKPTLETAKDDFCDRCGQDFDSAERLTKAMIAIEGHNKGCDEACGKTSSHQYVRENRRCDPRRDCPDCPRDWRVECPAP